MFGNRLQDSARTNPHSQAILLSDTKAPVLFVNWAVWFSTHCLSVSISRRGIDPISGCQPTLFRLLVKHFVLSSASIAIFEKRWFPLNRREGKYRMESPLPSRNVSGSEPLQTVHLHTTIADPFMDRIPRSSVLRSAGSHLYDASGYPQFRFASTIILCDPFIIARIASNTSSHVDHLFHNPPRYKFRDCFCPTRVEEIQLQSDFQLYIPQHYPSSSQIIKYHQAQVAWNCGGEHYLFLSLVKMIVTCTTHTCLELSGTKSNAFGNDRQAQYRREISQTRAQIQDVWKIEENSKQAWHSPSDLFPLWGYFPGWPKSVTII